MIHWTWLLVSVVISLVSCFFYVNYHVGKFIGVIDDITEAIKNHNISIAKLTKERIELLETILPPKPGLH